MSGWLYGDVQIAQAGAMVMVKYPYRKTSDLYGVLDGHIACCNCPGPAAPLRDGGFPAHIDYHDRRKRSKGSQL